MTAAELLALALGGFVLLSGLLPWWLLGRYGIPPAERLSLRELGPVGVLTTLRRGAALWVPPDRER